MAVKVCKHGVSVKNKSHNCTYVSLREKLVPAAERAADFMVGKRPPKGNLEAYEKYTKEWNLVFHREMDRLWALKEAELKAQAHELTPNMPLESEIEFEVEA